MQPSIDAGRVRFDRDCAPGNECVQTGLDISDTPAFTCQSSVRIATEAAARQG